MSVSSIVYFFLHRKLLEFFRAFSNSKRESLTLFLHITSVYKYGLLNKKFHICLYKFAEGTKYVEFSSCLFFIYIWAPVLLLYMSHWIGRTKISYSRCVFSLMRNKKTISSQIKHFRQQKDDENAMGGSKGIMEF